ncbi:hypothetical protein CcaverHIS002_0606280 [Cutaneotrichosporon cavernicola]|uniref:Uncharacterized protein n=1 Tax=Cutaneotrichosporon cavernicola TaxID=279322 RepID=A0AA48L902_9TREE|nr:uncharacterized protein CcaverHIS019_0605740 [Cutaneotrichosporon cavernicola]BEI86341.1 hypothetical protein CcaverHIS002_0606280 [Cutaneotrichosporon cavernicola]BEI94115.1 hypothetical protein CcaverHIS019_0605740 [Cutaneotrichosporon cavernicola]BEJ01894.1 hypothetical protein CcaverHIS631_0605760 [Cutaneotrichosporon cavernicola]BEJ09660.1 hypothetical protein CcaverHIS641_0605750 [Cutaneotrichosporon cavernicola]
MLLFPLLALFLPLVLAQGLGVSTSYWPVLSPSPTVPWVRGQKNLLSWRVAGGTGVQAFEIELHHWSRKVMQGALKIAYRYPMDALPGRYGNLGGGIEVELPSDIPTGEGFIVSFTSYYHGKVYAISEPFAILDQLPSNYTTPTGLASATYTATITSMPNPTQQWPLMLKGPEDKPSS